MKLIKAAITFKAEIPTDVQALVAHLEERRFTECGQLQLRSAGFVPVKYDGELVEPFPGGLAFRVRIDDKIIPGSVVREELAKRVKLTQEETGRKVGKKEKAEIRQGVMDDLAMRALVKTTASVTCFYEAATGYLMVACASKAIADVCVTLLIQAVGSVKTETIHVADVKHGVTTRLAKWLADDEDGFGVFQPCDEVVLSAEKRRVSVKMGDLAQARRGLTEAMLTGFRVKSIGFHHEGIDFRLTDDFHLKSITFPVADLENEEDNWWSAEAAVQVKAVSGVIGELVEMLSYKEDEVAA